MEFLLDVDGSFFFMEMNTRLQVEHPVTEMITGQDLVEWQLRVAMGERLPLAQDELTITGHSFEARLYAEDPEQDFLPATGTLTRFALDLEGAGLDADKVRLDSGVESGDVVSMHYDPMLAKLIVHGADRDQALATLNRALAALDVQGVVTNRAFLQRLATHPAFKGCELDTRFIEKHEESLFAPREITTEAYASAALIGLKQLSRECESDSPWDRHDGFRLNAPHTIRLALCATGHDLSRAQAPDAEDVVIVEGRRESAADPWQLVIGDETLTARIQHLEGDAVAVTLNGHRRRLQARLADNGVVVMADAAGETRLLLAAHRRHRPRPARGGIHPHRAHARHRGGAAGGAGPDGGERHAADGHGSHEDGAHHVRPRRWPCGELPLRRRRHRGPGRRAARIRRGGVEGPTR